MYNNIYLYVNIFILYKYLFMYLYVNIFILDKYIFILNLFHNNSSIFTKTIPIPYILYKCKYNLYIKYIIYAIYLSYYIYVLVRVSIAVKVHHDQGNS